MTTVSKENFEKKVTTTMVELHPQSSQRLDDGIKHTSGQHDRWMMRVKPIQVEYYFVENQKYYSNTM